MEQLEPNVKVVAALHSPNTGICDFGALCKSFVNDVLKTGKGALHLNFEVTNIEKIGEKVCQERTPALRDRATAITTPGALAKTPPTPPPCENRALVRAAVGVVSATFGVMSVGRCPATSSPWASPGWGGGRGAGGNGAEEGVDAPGSTAQPQIGPRKSQQREHLSPW